MGIPANAVAINCYVSHMIPSTLLINFAIWLEADTVSFVFTQKLLTSFDSVYREMHFVSPQLYNTL